LACFYDDSTTMWAFNKKAITIFIEAKEMFVFKLSYLERQLEIVIQRYSNAVLKRKKSKNQTPWISSIGKEG